MSGSAAKGLIAPQRYRRRRVKFGNPALGTYGGEVCTLDNDDSDSDASESDDDDDDDDENDTLGERSVQSNLSDRADSSLARAVAEKDGKGEDERKGRLVAMVEVPPEQVPEGVLNLVRGHRPNIEHVRIVITSDDAESRSDEIESRQSSPGSGMGYGRGQPATPKAAALAVESVGKLPPSPLPLTRSLSSGGHPSYPASPPLRNRSLSVSGSLGGATIEDAASILAADEVAESAKMEAWLKRQEALERLERQIEEDDGDEEPSMTYLILFLLSTTDAAEEFVNCIDGKPYTSLDEDVVCTVESVVSIKGDGGVSLISPFFAPTRAERGSPMVSPQLPKSAVATAAGGVCEAHNCAVCLESLDVSPACAGSDAVSTDTVASTAVTNACAATSTAIITTVCNHTFHIDCLLQWQDSPCPVCRYDHTGLNEALSQCNVCGTTENNFVCLICGVVSCGGEMHSNRLHGVAAAATTNQNGSHNGTDCHENQNHNEGNDSGVLGQLPAGQIIAGHAKDHYDGSLHAYALATESQHVWDFAGQGYVHRLIQNKDDMKIVEISDPSNTTSQERTLSPGLSDAQEGEVVHRKLEGFASQYYTLLKSQLEQQRIYYEGHLEEIRREHRHRRRGSTGVSGTGGIGGTTSDHIAALRSERSQLEARCATLRRRYRKVTDDVSFLKDMNESLESNKDPIRKDIVEAQGKRAEMKKMMVACLPPLEEKVNLLMMQLFESDDDTNEDKKPAARR